MTLTFNLLSEIELNAAGWTTFFCPAHGATMHTKKGTPQEPCTGRLDWLRRYEELDDKRKAATPLGKESNSWRAKEYEICRTCLSRPMLTKSRPMLTKKLTKKTGNGRRCSCGQKHYAKGMCKGCYMADYNKGWGR